MFFLSLIRGDYSGINQLIEYYKIKFGKNILSNYKKKTYIINVNGNVSKVIINGKTLKKENSNKFTYITFFPFNFNIVVYKTGCIPLIRKKIGYVPNKEIKINFYCKKLNKITCNNNLNYLKIGEFKADLSNICNTSNTLNIFYSYLTGNIAKKLGYLNLPVFDNVGYKLLGQSFDSYGMPIIILKNQKGNIIHKCIPLYYRLPTNNNLGNIEPNRYHNAIYWQKKGFPGWWNLDLNRGIRYAGYQQVYDISKKIMLAKYCYIF